MKRIPETQLWAGLVTQECNGKSAPYRSDWREVDAIHGSRAVIPPNGHLEYDFKLIEGPLAPQTRPMWFALVVTTDPKPGTPGVGLSVMFKGERWYVRKDDIVHIRLELSATKNEDEASFGFWNMIDHGELQQLYFRQIAALPAVWKVKALKRRREVQP